MSELRTNKIYPRDGLPSGASGGGIVQVVFASTDEMFTTTSTSPITVLSASITPTSPSNKILIQYTALVSYDGDANHVNTVILKNGSIITAAQGSRGTAGNTYNANKIAFVYIPSQDGNTFDTTSGSYLDSPATTSTITYGIGGYSNNSNTSAFNRRVNSSAYNAVTELILMEVSG
jgi:hypothetical protein